MALRVHLEIGPIDINRPGGSVNRPYQR